MAGSCDFSFPGAGGVRRRPRSFAYSYLLSRTHGHPYGGSHAVSNADSHALSGPHAGAHTRPGANPLGYSCANAYPYADTNGGHGQPICN